MTNDSEEEGGFSVAAVSYEVEAELPATVTNDSEEEGEIVATGVRGEEVAAIQLHVEHESLSTTKPALNVISRYDAEAFPSSSSNSRRSYTSVYDSTKLRLSKPPTAQPRLSWGNLGHNSFNRHLKQEGYQFRSTSHSYVRPSKKGYK